MLTEADISTARTVQYAWKLFDGGELYLLVAPNGGWYWRYKYRIDGKHKTLALGVFPDVPLHKARARHQKAKAHLADGIDPAIEKRARQRRFP
jgi:hypothetical protein